jgi:hypothetical protein
MQTKQQLPINIIEFIDQLRAYNARNRITELETSYEGINYSESPSETFRVTIEAKDIALMNLFALPQGLQIENVFCHPRPDGVAMTIELIRQRTEQ